MNGENHRPLLTDRYITSWASGLQETHGWFLEESMENQRLVTDELVELEINNRLRLETSGESPVILEESMDRIYLKWIKTGRWCQHVTSWTLNEYAQKPPRHCNGLDLILIKTYRMITTHNNLLDFLTIGFWPIMPKNLHGNCFSLWVVYVSFYGKESLQFALLWFCIWIQILKFNVIHERMRSWEVP